MTRERRLLAKVDRVQGNRRRPLVVKGRLEFRDEDKAWLLGTGYP